jgi:hypothetical protein
MEKRITDVRLSSNDNGFIYLEFPIKTGSLTFKILPGTNDELEEFLHIVIRSRPRRFGEQPSVD